jgi:hypothetical protein
MKIKILKNSILPKILRVQGITIYPFIFLAMKDPSKKLLNHEMIHVKQVRKYGWLRFYLSYVVEFLSYVIRGDTMDVAYNRISYEREAYANEHKDQGPIC